MRKIYPVETNPAWCIARTRSPAKFLKNLTLATLLASVFTLPTTTSAQAGWWSWFFSPAPTCSFAPQTNVLMGDGSHRSIASLKVGDMVASGNEQNQMRSISPVTDVYNSWHHDKVTLTIVDSHGRTETLITTTEHPFYVSGVGFVPASNLETGMVLSQHQDKPKSALHLVSSGDNKAGLTVKNIKVINNGVPHKAWNLTVAMNHTFFVGQSNAWVHNDCAQDKKDAKGLALQAVTERANSGFFTNSATKKKTLGAVKMNGKTWFFLSGYKNNPCWFCSKYNKITRDYWKYQPNIDDVIAWAKVDPSTNKSRSYYRSGTGFGHDTKRDNNKPGSSKASHSEIQILFKYEKSIKLGRIRAIGFAKEPGTPQTMCSSCQKFFRLYVQNVSKKKLYVSSTEYLYKFDATGTIYKRVKW